MRYKTKNNCLNNRGLAFGLQRLSIWTKCKVYKILIKLVLLATDLKHGPLLINDHDKKTDELQKHDVWRCR